MRKRETPTAYRSFWSTNSAKPAFALPACRGSADPVCAAADPETSAAGPLKSGFHTRAAHALNALLLQKRAEKSTPAVRSHPFSWSRLVMIPPSVVRGRRSVRMRTTEFQAAGSSTASPEYPRVRSPMAPIESGPACPVSRPPPAISPRSPTRRLKKTSVCRGVPNWNSPARSRKNSRFSG